MTTARLKQVGARIAISALLYGSRAWLAKGLRAGLLIGALGPALGCAHAPQPAPPDGVASMSAPEVLYHAILSTYESENLAVDTASQRFLLVTSKYRAVDENTRQRIVSRVIEAAPGAMGLRITVEWQQRESGAETSDWHPIDTPQLRERAHPTELRLGRAIEARFTAWGAR